MKKIALTILFLVIFAVPTSAKTKTVKIMALTDFSTENPSPLFKAEIIEDKEFKGELLEAGTIVEGQITRVANPKAGKRNAYFVFLPYIVIRDEETIIVDKPLAVAKVTDCRPIDTKKLTIKAIKTSTNFIFKGMSMGISFVEGAVKAEENQRIQSGLINIYNDSPLSYIETGKELNIKPGDILILKLKEFERY